MANVAENSFFIGVIEGVESVGLSCRNVIRKANVAES